MLCFIVFNAWGNANIVFVSEDTDIAENAKDANYGKVNWTVVWRSAGWNRETWYKFELPPIEEGQRIHEAHLKAFIFGEGDDSGPIGVFFCPDNDWDEEEITWNNAPHDKVESVPFAVATPTANNTIVSWDIAPFLRANREKTSLTFVLRSIGEPCRRGTYYSKESGMTKPQIEYTTVIHNGGSVRGIITDLVGTLIEEPTIDLLDGSRNLIKTIFADEDGFYELLDIDPGNYILRVEKAPFAPSEALITIGLDSHLVQNITLFEHEGVIDLIVAADTTAEQSAPDANRGSQNWTTIWNASGYNKHTWYKFELPSLPSNYRLKSASLKSYAMTNGDKIGEVGVYYCPNDGWEEGTLTWNNMPSEVESVPISVTTPTANNAYASWDVKHAILKDGWGSSLTLVLKVLSSTGYSEWITKEYLGGTSPNFPPPRLVLEYEYISPGTVMGKVQDRNGNIKVGALVKGITETGNILGTTVTDGNGEFIITDLYEGCRLLTEVDGYAQTYTEISFHASGWGEAEIVLRDYNETHTLRAIEDSNVHQAQKENNFGSQNWTVIWNSAGWNNHTYYKFNLPEIGENFRIVSATLESYVWTNGDKIGSVGVYYCSDNNWRENELNWNNAPHDAADSEPISIGFPEGNNVWASFNVKDAFDKISPSSSSLTLVLKAMGATGYSNWYSKEYMGGSYAPRINLVLEYIQPGTVMGKVQDRSGNIKAGVVVKGISETGDILTTTVTDENGKFVIDDLYEGCRLFTEVDGYARTYTEINFHASGWGEAEIVLRDYNETYILRVIEDSNAYQAQKENNFGSQNWTVIWNSGGYNNHTYYK